MIALVMCWADGIGGGLCASVSNSSGSNRAL